jgi:hypothetical protein
MSIKDLKEYMVAKKKQQIDKWKKDIIINGECQPFTDKDYIKNTEIIFTGKKHYKTKFVHNKIWKTTF